MIHDPAISAAGASPSDAKLRGLLGGMSIFTMIMTGPQVWAIWAGHQAAGVSILSWSAYFASALLWLWFGIRQRDRNIYLPRLGWIASRALQPSPARGLPLGTHRGSCAPGGRTRPPRL